jgi:dTDP-4-dehydrorhamnose 3,5-epimerase
MKFEKTSIPGLNLIHPKVWKDERGLFWESYTEAQFKDNSLTTNFVQDNESISKKGVVRGLHLQLPPCAQAKLLKVSFGSILDVCVDLRKGSPSYGEHYSVVLSSANRRMLYIPEGLAHGFLSLEGASHLRYKCSNPYSKTHEVGIIWNDADLNINWGTTNPTVSPKDKEGIKFKDFDSPF